MTSSPFFFLLSFVLLIPASFAFEYTAENKAIEEYRDEVYFNPNNYVSSLPDRLPVMNAEYRRKLMLSPLELKFFMVCSAKHFMKRPFQAIYAEDFSKKFGPLTQSKVDRIADYLADAVYRERNDVSKKMIQSPDELEKYLKLKLNVIYERQHL